MNYIFNRKQEGKNVRLFYETGNDISLGGYKNGIIANRLKDSVSKEQVIPFAWTIPIAKEYNGRGQAILIDIKPNSSEFFFCELITVYGVCYEEWTAIMYNLRRLLPYMEKDKIDEDNFVYNGRGYETIYTMLYFYGSFENGELIGTWNPPRPGSANSLLLWPEALSFFYRKIKEHDKNLLNSTISEIGLLPFN